MALNDTPSAERIHIAFFGKRNVGKSSVVNAVTGQDLSVVSDVKGTTTDPVYKTMELLPLGPVVIIDTPGMDDEGTLGELRVKKTRQILNKTDIAVLVVDVQEGMAAEDRELLSLIRQRQLPYLIVYNKADLLLDGKEKQQEEERLQEALQEYGNAGDIVEVSALNGEGIRELKEKLGELGPKEKGPSLLEGMVKHGDMVVLVIPVDKAAPKGRLILPQQQTIRALLDEGCVAVTVKDSELEQALGQLGKKPSLIITDSQVFGKVSKIVPQDAALTSFSILFARYKGDLQQVLEGAAALKTLQDGDRILIAEGCTHHRQCGDIGTIKLPRWIQEYTGRELRFEYASGNQFPENLECYRLIVHCGGCMLNERQMKWRLLCAKEQKVPITNYGILIACIHGILMRSVAPIPGMAGLLERTRGN